MTRRTCVVLAACCAAAAALAVLPALAADWPQWRGPERDGRAAGENPAAWPERLRQAWSRDVGEGHSSPVAAGGRVFQHARQNEREVVWCLDVASGETLWSDDYAAPYEMHSAARAHGKGPKSTPVVAEGHLVTLGISGILSCYEAEEGDLLWRRDFAERFEATSPLYGTAMSPLVHGGVVIAHVGGHNDGALAAFDLATGTEKWAWDGDGPGYASPVIAVFDGTEQIVTQTQNAIVGVSPSDGELLWKVPFKTAYDQNSVTPVVDRGRLLVSGVNEPLRALRVSRNGDDWTTEEAWQNADIPLYMSTPVLAQDRLFGMTHRQRGALFCADPTDGRTLWIGEGRAGDNAAFLALGDQILVLTTDGRLRVLDNDPSALKVAAEYHLAETPTWAHPALAAGRLLVKDAQRLTCWSWQAP